MISESVEIICNKKIEELIEEYFGNLVKEAAIEQPETIGDYSLDLPLIIENEFKTFLEELWKEVAPDDLKGTPLVLEEQKLRELSTKSSRENLNLAYEKAMKCNVWERMTQSNHKDVSYYKFMLRDYTRELLTVTRLDFMEEITGKHINTKSFENN